MTDLHQHHKTLLQPLFTALYEGDETAVKAALDTVMSDDCIVHLAHPFGSVTGSQAYWDIALSPLFSAWPDCERRAFIQMAGTDTHGADWVGCGGHFIGTFTHPFLNIPPTGHLAHMRFHEFYRFENDKIVEIQSLWDIPEVFMQAGAWPLAPSLGREWHVPGPSTQDGMISLPYDDEKSLHSRQLIMDMLAAMIRHPEMGGPEVMEMERFWHRKMTWYGPCGIGTARGISGFRNWHQIPFLNSMPDRGQYDEQITFHFFAEADYVAVTGWPNMIQTHSAGGWLGLPPTNKKLEIRSLDFWRIENNLIRENWVLVDLLHIFDQLGIDVFARLSEFNKARNLSPVMPPGC